jgi:hypothetical protein
MADQFPVDEIARVVDWNARKVLERGGRNEIVLAEAAHRGVWVETRYDGIGDFRKRCDGHDCTKVRTKFHDARKSGRHYFKRTTLTVGMILGENDGEMSSRTSWGRTV